MADIVIKWENVPPFIRNFKCKVMDVPEELVDRVEFGDNEITIVFYESYKFCVEKYLIDSSVELFTKGGDSRFIRIVYTNLEGKVYRTDTFRISGINDIRCKSGLFSGKGKLDDEHIKTVATFKYNRHDIATDKKQGEDDSRKEAEKETDKERVD